MYTENFEGEINEFRGKYFFLSNFYNASVLFDGINYLNTEAAFQAQKCEYWEDRKEFSNLNPSEAKRKGRHVTLRPNWELLKVGLMSSIVRAKFEQHPDLKKKLIATGNTKLIEGNTWNDTFWGVCKGKGFNTLGKILMGLREEFKEE